MVKVDVLTSKLADLELRIERVEQHRKPSAEALRADSVAMDVVAFNLMLAVQVCADVASHVIASEKYAPSGTIAGSFARLAEHGVLTSATAQRLAAAAGLRNAVAHGYATVDVEAVQRASTSGVDDLRLFAGEVARWLESNVPR